MRRVASPPRADWQKRVEAAGLTWHTAESQPYWSESAFYEFTAKEVDLLAAAANELEEMTRKAVQHVIDNQLYAKLRIPEGAVPVLGSGAAIALRALRSDV
jgi:glutathionylspermidine synthase